MSYTDVGKEAKYKGVLHPKHARKFDPEPAKPTPKVKPRRKVEKPYGYSIDYLNGWWRHKSAKWERQYTWFKTEAARDQSMQKLSRSLLSKSCEFYRGLQRETRC